MPSTVAEVDVGGMVTQVVAGATHTCALLASGGVRCWGDSEHGALGYGNLSHVGNDESPASAGDVNVGGTVVGLAAGDSHTWALLTTGAVRCWGYGFWGGLGYAAMNDIGDDEVPASAGDIDLGGLAVAIASGSHHTCALLDSGRVRCWGRSSRGQLGYGHTNDIGEDETPASAGDVPL